MSAIVDKPVYYYLAGDVGGTNSRFSLYEVDHGSVKFVCSGCRTPGVLKYRQTYKNADHASFADVVKLFQSCPEVSVPIECACFAVAGPVKCNAVRLTNLSHWIIDGAALEIACDIKVVQIVNDFVGAGYGLLTLDNKKDCITIQEADPIITAPIACVGAGTGLGECFLTPHHIPMSASTKPTCEEDMADGRSSKDSVSDKISYTCFSAEGGHVEFAPRNALEIELLQFLLKDHDRVSVERTVSGQGICNIYDFMVHKFPDQVNAMLHESIIADDQQKSALIAQSAQTDVCCRQAMEMFASIYGSEAGNVCLKYMPFGGLYLAGGITPKNIDIIAGATSPFLTAFHNKGRVSDFLKSIPIYAVNIEDVGERGAQFVAFRDLIHLHGHQ